MRRLALWLSASMGLASPACAQTSGYYSQWFIEPTPGAIEVTVKKEDFVVKSRLLPPGLIELTEDVVEPLKGAVLARAGDQLFQAAAGRARKQQPELDLGVYCTFRPLTIEVAGWFSPLFGREKGVRYLCFVDADHDGRIEGGTEGSCTTFSFPIISGNLPRKPPAMTGGAYRKLAPTEIRDGPVVGIIFTGLRRDGAANLDLRFGGGEMLPSLLSPDSKAEAPRQRKILGARISVVEGGGAEARLRIDEGIPLQPFSMYAQGCPPG